MVQHLLATDEANVANRLLSFFVAEFWLQSISHPQRAPLPHRDQEAHQILRELNARLLDERLRLQTSSKRRSKASRERLALVVDLQNKVASILALMFGDPDSSHYDDLRAEAVRAVKAYEDGRNRLIHRFARQIGVNVRSKSDLDKLAQRIKGVFQPKPPRDGHYLKIVERINADGSEVLKPRADGERGPIVVRRRMRAHRQEGQSNCRSEELNPG